MVNLLVGLYVNLTYYVFNIDKGKIRSYIAPTHDMQAYVVLLFAMQILPTGESKTCTGQVDTPV